MNIDLRLCFSVVFCVFPWFHFHSLSRLLKKAEWQAFADFGNIAFHLKYFAVFFISASHRCLIFYNHRSALGTTEFHGDRPISSVVFCVFPWFHFQYCARSRGSCKLLLRTALRCSQHLPNSHFFDDLFLIKSSFILVLFKFSKNTPFKMLF